MAPNLLLLEDATFSISRGSVHVEMSGASVSVPVNRLGDVIRALEGIRFIVDGTSPTGAVARTAPDAPGPPGAARGVAPASARAVGSGDAPASLVDVPVPPKKKRRSRKRVGDALEVWMKKNPGWHSEQELLEVVIANQMTDAHPKRALKIALGKQADERFERDDSGNWRLLGDTDDTRSGDGGARKTAAKARSPRATSGQGGGRRLKAKAEGDDAGEAAPASDDDDDGESSRTVLVKRGQDRKSASLPPGEIEARQAASDAVESRRGKRWPSLKQAELDRFKKNLFGLESTNKE